MQARCWGNVGSNNIRLTGAGQGLSPAWLRLRATSDTLA